MKHHRIMYRRSGCLMLMQKKVAGRGGAHKVSAHKARHMGAEEKWLSVHQKHLDEVRDEWDVIFYGDDLVEAWR